MDTKDQVRQQEIKTHQEAPGKTAGDKELEEKDKLPVDGVDPFMGTVCDQPDKRVYQQALQEAVEEADQPYSPDTGFDICEFGKAYDKQQGKQAEHRVGKQHHAGFRQEDAKRGAIQ